MSPQRQPSSPPVKSYCRFCHAYCALEVEVEDNRVMAVRADRSDPVYGGYTCIKGRQLPEQHNHPDRILRPLRRNSKGELEPVSKEEALDEIAARLKQIIERHGPESVASYCGTYAFQNSAALAVSRAWHEGIGSPSYYTSVTIDQPAKFIAPTRIGLWAGGSHGFEDADVVLLIGSNTVVSQYSPFGGIPSFNPYKRLRDAQKRGLDVICIDPRRTEVARRADLHLQVRPGEDPTLLSAMLKIILEENLHDRDFCNQYVEGVAELQAAVSDFSLEYAAERSGIPAEQIELAARRFAKGPRGVATTGTGPNMSPRPNLTEHLTMTLNVLCGRFYREGERVPNPGILARASRRRAEVVSLPQSWGNGPRLRVRDLGQIFGEMPTAALSDEILMPGPGQVRALLCLGGNPVVAWPDQLKTIEAIDSLDLFVAVDPKLSASAKRADFVMAPVLSLEREDVTLLTDQWYEPPYSHYTEACITPGPELIEEWEFYWELAHRLGTPIRLPGGELDLDEMPSKFSVLEKVVGTPRVPLADIRAYDGGHRFDDIEVRVEAAKPGADSRFKVSPDGIAEELREVRGEDQRGDQGYAGDSEPFSHRLISRRLKHVYNSSGRDLTALRAVGKTNPAYMNPDDLAALGLESGDLVEIVSEHASILGVAEATKELRSGVVSMAHAWGDGPERDGAVREIGSSTNRLVDNAKHFDPISGMARQSAIPVNVRRVSEAPREAGA